MMMAMAGAGSHKVDAILHSQHAPNYNAYRSSAIESRQCVAVVFMLPIHHPWQSAMTEMECQSTQPGTGTRLPSKHSSRMHCSIAKTRSPFQLSLHGLHLPTAVAHVPLWQRTREVTALNYGITPIYTLNYFSLRNHSMLHRNAQTTRPSRQEERKENEKKGYTRKETRRH